MPASAGRRAPATRARISEIASKLLDDGRNGGAAPGTMAAAQARIAETLAVVEAAWAEGIVIDPASGIAHALPIGIVLDVTAERYARDWALPQFFLHVMTA